MIRRSPARRSSGGGGGSGGNIVDLADHQPSSKSETKAKEKRRSSSSSRSSFMLPFVLAFASFAVIMRTFRPILLKSHSTRASDYTLKLFRSDRKPSSDNDAKYKLTPKHKFPKGWQHFSYEHIRHHFNCRQRSKDMNKPLPSLQDWEFLRQTYTHILSATTTIQQPWTNDLVPPTLGYSLVPGIPVPPPYYAKHSPGKGRGLFASRPISKGELVHDGQVSDITIPNAMIFREFVFSLPRDYACDAAEWIWMQQVEEGGEYRILMGMNISALMNSGGADWGDGQLKMVNALPENEYSGRFYATRDIEEGEEILTDYDVYYTKWTLVGLGEG